MVQIRVGNTLFKVGDKVVSKAAWISDCRYGVGTIIAIDDLDPQFFVKYADGCVSWCSGKDTVKVDPDFKISCSSCLHYYDACNNCHNYHDWEPAEELKNESQESFNIFVGGRGSCKSQTALQFFKQQNDLYDLFTRTAVLYKKENKNMKKQQKKRDRNIIKVKDPETETRRINEIMFNGPATIIKWDPTQRQLAYGEAADKTVTVAKEPDKFDKTTGFLLAVLKEVLDNQSYGNILEKIDEINKESK